MAILAVALAIFGAVPSAVLALLIFGGCVLLLGFAGWGSDEHLDDIGES